ncbi:MAG: ABC transporter ATP-binding protein [Clostridia bacterium]|nr:ABC transporter ATP-binding protein [Clostridia bacterium]
MKLLWQYLKPYKKQLIIGPAFKLSEAILEILVPTLMAKYLIDIGIASQDTAYVIKIGLLMLALAVIGLGCALVCQHSASVASQGFGTNLRGAVFEHICALSFREFDTFGSATLLNRITNDINILQQSVAMIIRLVIRAPFIVLGSFIMASVINIKLGLIILATAPIFALIIWLVMRKTIPLYRKIQKKLDKIALVAAESLDGVRVIRAFAKKDKERAKFKDTTEEFVSMSVRVGKISAILNPATLLVLNFLIISVLWAGGIQVNAGGMTKGDIIAVTTYISYIMTAMLVVADLIILFIRAGVAKDRVCELLLTEPDITYEKAHEITAESNTVVSFEHVGFSYTGAEKALDDISFSLKKGESLGIIGGIGSGKSTLVSLIARFYDVDCGAVKINGRDVREYSREQLHRCVSIAMQKSHVFKGTIRENILQGNPAATEQQLQRACAMAQADEFICLLPDGLLTSCEEGGSNFSGGQRQRICLARALIAQAPILILDDSSSALDYATDLRLRKALASDYDGTVITVSQRIGTIKHADKILVLDDGACVGFDSHKNLLRTCETYRAIYASQTKREVHADD